MRPSLTWRQAIAAFSRDARLYLSSAALMGFTIFGGVYSLLMNLYLLRLGYGPGAIGVANAAGLLGWALACLPAGRLGRRWNKRLADGDRHGTLDGRGPAAAALRDRPGRGPGASRGSCPPRWSATSRSRSST